MCSVSYQSHRFLFYRCTQDFFVALTLTMTHHFNATRANVSCARAQIGISAPSFSLISLFWSRLRDTRIVCNHWMRQIILALIWIPQVVSSCETYLIAFTCSMRLRRDRWWWNWRVVVDGGVTRVLWSGRAIGLPGYVTNEESPRTTPDFFLISGTCL